MAKMSDAQRKAFSELIQATTADKVCAKLMLHPNLHQSVSEFVARIEGYCEGQDIYLPKVDKQTKRLKYSKIQMHDRNRALEEDHQQALKEQLQATDDLLAVSHIVVTLVALLLL